MATRRKKPKVTEKILPIPESKYKLNLKHFNITDKQKDFLKMQNRLIFLYFPVQGPFLARL